MQIRLLTLVGIEVVRADGMPVEELVELLVSDDSAISMRPARHTVQIMGAVVPTSSLSIAMCELIMGVRARCHSISITSSMSHSLSSFSRNAIAKLALTSRACRLFMIPSQIHSSRRSSDAQGWNEAWIRHEHSVEVKSEHGCAVSVGAMCEGSTSLWCASKAGGTVHYTPTCQEVV